MRRKTSTCRSCPQEVKWVTTIGGTQQPLNPSPDPEGNVFILANGKARTLNTDEQQRARAAGAMLWMPHHATCPGRSKHKVPRGQGTLL